MPGGRRCTPTEGVSKCNKESLMNKAVYAAIALLVALAIAAGWYFLRPKTPALTMPPEVAQPEAPPPPVVGVVPDEPGLQHPIEESPAVAQSPSLTDEEALPPPDAADPFIEDALTRQMGRTNVLTWLNVDDFARRVAATVDNLARPHASSRLWPVNPIGDRFLVDEPLAGASGAAGTNPPAGAAIAAGNAQRYASFVRWSTSLDTATTVALYVRLYPLFQHAYEDLGYPGRHFNDRVVEVIDHLLQTPEPTQPLELRLTEIKGPFASERPWVRYEFADPELESRSAGQKMLLRMGNDNARQLKAKLREVRARIAQRTANR
jgi:hypothetical protein